MANIDFWIQRPSNRVKRYDGLNTNKMPLHLSNDDFFKNSTWLFVLLIFFFGSILSIYVLTSVLWCPLRFPHKNDVRSSLPPIFCKEESCLINVICVCLCIVVSNTYCVVFLIFFFVFSFRLLLFCFCCCFFLNLLKQYRHYRFPTLSHIHSNLLQWQSLLSNNSVTLY
jgi:hypothetical protein